MTWVKICGTTNLEDARAAAEAGADAVGFVFAESPRQIQPEAAAKIVRELSPQVEKVGVFVHQPVERICEVVEQAELTAVQLHWNPRPQFVPMLRKRLRSGARRVRVVEVWRLEEFPPKKPFALDFPEGEARPDAFLLDSKSSRVRGGSGETFDWESWATFLKPRSLRRMLPPLIVAGGLTSANVREAIRLFRPWGVDVVSGVEREPGKKDHEKVRAFVAAVRAAEKG